MSRMSPTFDLNRFISQRIAQGQPGPRERLLAMAQGRRDVISLGRGDPDLATPRHIIDAAKHALDEGATHYTPWQGRADLRAAIAEKCRRDYGADVGPEQVVLTAGAQEAVYIVFQAVLDPGDEVILADPHYTAYSNAIRLAGGVPVCVSTGERTEFALDPDAVEARISARTKILAVVTPNNPTGAVIGPDVIKALSELACRHNLLLLADDIYERFVYEGPPHASIAALPHVAERTIMINGFSKTYAMTGWRLGYLVAPRPLIPTIEVLKHTLTICAPAVSQAAGLAALTGPQGCVEEMCATYAERRAICLEWCDRLELGGRWSRGGLYVFASITSTNLTADEFCLRVLEDANVLIFPGTAFGGGEGYVRMSFLQPAAQLRIAMERLAPLVRRLQSR